MAAPRAAPDWAEPGPAPSSGVAGALVLGVLRSAATLRPGRRPRMRRAAPGGWQRVCCLLQLCLEGHLLGLDGRGLLARAGLLLLGAGQRGCGLRLRLSALARRVWRRRRRRRPLAHDRHLGDDLDRWLPAASSRAARSSSCAGLPEVISPSCWATCCRTCSWCGRSRADRGLRDAEVRGGLGARRRRPSPWPARRVLLLLGLVAVEGDVRLTLGAVHGGLRGGQLGVDLPHLGRGRVGGRLRRADLTVARVDRLGRGQPAARSDADDGDRADADRATQPARCSPSVEYRSASRPRVRLPRCTGRHSWLPFGNSLCAFSGAQVIRDPNG